MNRLTRTLLLAGLTLGGLTLNGACFFDNDDERDQRRSPSLECDTDDQCAHLDDGDKCFGAPYCDVVVAGHVSHCSRDFLQDDVECQCVSGLSCQWVTGFEQQPCNVFTCDNHLCGEEIAPEGPADDLQQDRGDCSVIMCDGVGIEGEVVDDPEDLPDDSDVCTVDQCTDMGPENIAVANGEVCTDGSGLCYTGRCYAGCVPSDPTSCGSEGPGETSNNDASGALSLAEHTETCGMLDGDDMDWYVMSLVDEDFVEDIFELSIVSSASTLEVCAFMDCNGSGTALGGCASSSKLTGPGDSVGCCWRGAPSSILPSWDIDCSDQSDDGGTMYIAVSAPDGDSCETYALAAHY